jgi:hypothetical protein
MRLIGDDENLAAWLDDAKRCADAISQGVEFAVQVHPDGEKSFRRRVNAPRAHSLRDGAAHDVCQRDGSRNALLSARGDDGASDARGVAIFAEAANERAQLALGHRIDEVRGGVFRFSLVDGEKRAIAEEAEAALGFVEGSGAESAVNEHGVNKSTPKSGENCLQISIVSTYQPVSGSVNVIPLELFTCQPEHFVISIKSNHFTIRRSSLEEFQAVSACSNSAIKQYVARLGSDYLQHLVQENRDVQKRFI